MFRQQLTEPTLFRVECSSHMTFRSFLASHQILDYFMMNVYPTFISFVGCSMLSISDVKDRAVQLSAIACLLASILCSVFHCPCSALWQPFWTSGSCNIPNIGEHCFVSVFWCKTSGIAYFWLLAIGTSTLEKLSVPKESLRPKMCIDILIYFTEGNLLNYCVINVILPQFRNCFVLPP